MFVRQILAAAAGIAFMSFILPAIGSPAAGQEIAPAQTKSGLPPAAEKPATEKPSSEETPADPENPADPEKPSGPEKVDLAGLKRLAKDYDVWIDLERKLVVVDGKVCLRHGPLEMFACPRGTKEHEAIVSVNSPAKFVHAALLAVGAKQGSPVRFRPEYIPASGTTVDIWILWKDAAGDNQKVRAQEWIKNATTEKAMEYDWVFGGSGFWTDEETGERHYHADGGDFICVSNFSTAMMDLPVESSQTNDELLFTAFTEKIPPKDTQVRLVLVPRIPREPTGGSNNSTAPPKP